MPVLKEIKRGKSKSTGILPQKQSIKEKMNWLKFDSSYNNLFKNLHQEFYSTEYVKELNLTLLNPSYFRNIHNEKTKRSIDPHSNTKFLRNCYIDLIRHDRLT